MIIFDVRQKPYMQTTQDENWLLITVLEWEGKPVNSSNKLHQDQIKLWIDDDYSSDDNYLSDSEGYEDYAGFDDVDGDGFISHRDRLLISGLVIPINHQYVVTVYYYPYEVEHFGLPTMITYSTINTTRFVYDLI